MTTNARIGDALRGRIAEAWPEIIAALAAGELVKTVLARHELKREHIAAYMASTPQARVEWESARESSAESFMDEALEIARSDLVEVMRDDKGAPLRDDKGALIVVRGDSAHARTRIDTLKWCARIRNPRQYSDKSTIDVNHRHVDLTRIIADARARMLAARQPVTIDAQVVDAPEAAAPALPPDLL